MAAALKKNTGPLYKISIFSPEGQVNHKCEILDVIKNIGLYIRYKKPRSSKFARRTVPWSQIIAYGKGEKGTLEGFISYKSQRVPILRPFKGTVDFDEATGLHIVTSDENIIYHVRPDCLEAVADESDDAPAKETKPKKK